MAARVVGGTLLLLLLLLQQQLWWGDGGVRDMLRLGDTVAQLHDENERLTERNRRLRAEVDDLKRGLDVVEERARQELGMVRQGETFIQLVTSAAEVRER